MVITTVQDTNNGDKILEVSRGDSGSGKLRCWFAPSIIKVALIFCFVGYDSSHDWSPFRCLCTKSECIDIHVECIVSVLPVVLVVILGLTLLIPDCSIFLTCSFQVTQICLLAWLKFNLEKFQYFAHNQISIGYFGYVVLCGAIIADIATIPSSPIKHQMAYTTFIFAAIVTSLISEYIFSQFWTWTQTNTIILILTLVFMTLISLIMETLVPEHAKEDRLRFSPYISIAGLLILLLVIIPSCQFDLYFHQVALVAMGTIVYTIQWWIPVFRKSQTSTTAIADM